MLDTSKIVISIASCQGIVGLSSLSLNSPLMNELRMYIFFDNNFESFQLKKPNICKKKLTSVKTKLKSVKTKLTSVKTKLTSVKT